MVRIPLKPDTSRVETNRKRRIWRNWSETKYRMPRAYWAILERITRFHRKKSTSNKKQRRTRIIIRKEKKKNWKKFVRDKKPDTNESFSNFLKWTEKDKIEGRSLLDEEELWEIPQTQKICLKLFEGANSMIQSEKTSEQRKETQKLKQRRTRQTKNHFQTKKKKKKIRNWISNITNSLNKFQEESDKIQWKKANEWRRGGPERVRIITLRKSFWTGPYTYSQDLWSTVTRYK